jgi:hypothetical protein
VYDKNKNKDIIVIILIKEPFGKISALHNDLFRDLDNPTIVNP